MQNFRALGAPPPDPHASGGLGLAPKPHWPPGAGCSTTPPNTDPNCEFLATRLRNTVVRFRTKSVSI